MIEPRAAVKPPDEFYPHTARGRHARRPFGRGWMVVEEWDGIKDDPTPMERIPRTKEDAASQPARMYAFVETARVQRDNF